MKKNLKYIIPSILGVGAAAAVALKKASKPEEEKKPGIKGKVSSKLIAYKDGIKNRFDSDNDEEVITLTVDPIEHNPEEFKKTITELVCMQNITEGDWMQAGMQILFATIEQNYKDMLRENNIVDIEPKWNGYVATDSGSGAYILKTAKEGTETAYFFYEESTGYIASTDEGLAYLLKLKHGISVEDFEKQNVIYTNYFLLMETLVDMFEIEETDDENLLAKLEEGILEKYYDVN